jgi:hypothetical protein
MALNELSIGPGMTKKWLLAPGIAALALTFAISASAQTAPTPAQVKAQADQFREMEEFLAVYKRSNPAMSIRSMIKN